MIRRHLVDHIKEKLRKFPVVSVTGPRQSGKTTLLKNEFPDYIYINLERFDQREMIQSDPYGFLNNYKKPVIFDEAQQLPELFSYIQVLSDERNLPGQYILSGSQSFLLNANISQSLAGRVNINHLFPFDVTELAKSTKLDIYETMLYGFYPRIYDQHIHPRDFYPSYLQTYIERDIRLIKSIENLSTFSRFLSLCAGRIGQVLNISSLANDTGISVNTAKSWLSLLESSFIIYLLQPYYNNFNKRVIKSPKIYFYDTGVASSLLRISSVDMIPTHYLYGSLFENMVISEIIKYNYHRGRHPSVYYWRESNGTEIDCIMEQDNHSLVMLEIKGGQTYTKDYLKNLDKFSDKAGNKNIQKVIIYPGQQSMKLKDIRIIPWHDFVSFLHYTGSK